MKALYQLLSSMRFAVVILSLIGIASVVGTVLKQNQSYSDYILKFGHFWFSWFEALGLYDVYHSIGFLALLLFLLVSVTLCIYRNAPGMWREWRGFKDSISEKSFALFEHHGRYFLPQYSEQLMTRLKNMLEKRGFRYKIVERSQGILIAARIGMHQRLGYFLSHSAIVIICLGGFLDGDLPFKIDELIGTKQVATLNMPADQVGKNSRLNADNFAFRANLNLAEGETGQLAFVRVRDGYVVQELPFSLTLHRFRIQRYASGPPKSFESDVTLHDNQSKQNINATISVNHPLVYKGISIYQSDFRDGGSLLNFSVWELFTSTANHQRLSGHVFTPIKLGVLRVELDDFKPFNVLDLSADGKGAPRNVGPSVLFKMRDASGVAREYVNYMQPLTLDNKSYFVSGMRASPREDFSYWRIPIDPQGNINGFMAFRAAMFNPARHNEIAQRVVNKLGSHQQQALTNSLVTLLGQFAQGGYASLANTLGKKVPAAEQQKAAAIYAKIIGLAAWEAYQLGQINQGKTPLPENVDSITLVQESLTALSDMFFYGSPYYLSLQSFEQKQASGFQITKSPGKPWVYAGSVLLVLGVFCMFYVSERRLWLLVKPVSHELLFAMSVRQQNSSSLHEIACIRSDLKTLLQGN